jgi:hypothetical protein
MQITSIKFSASLRKSSSSNIVDCQDVSSSTRTYNPADEYGELKLLFLQQHRLWLKEAHMSKSARLPSVVEILSDLGHPQRSNHITDHNLYYAFEILKLSWMWLIND